MSRTTLRYVPHTIKHVSESGITFEAFCAMSGCDADSGPLAEQETAEDWALEHTGRTGHALFRRVVTDHAQVTRSE